MTQPRKSDVIWWVTIGPWAILAGLIGWVYVVELLVAVLGDIRDAIRKPALRVVPAPAPPDWEEPVIKPATPRRRRWL